MFKKWLKKEYPDAFGYLEGIKTQKQRNEIGGDTKKTWDARYEKGNLDILFPYVDTPQGHRYWSSIWYKWWKYRGSPGKNIANKKASKPKAKASDEIKKMKKQIAALKGVNTKLKAEAKKANDDLVYANAALAENLYDYNKLFGTKIDKNTEIARLKQMIDNRDKTVNGFRDTLVDEARKNTRLENTITTLLERMKRGNV